MSVKNYVYAELSPTEYWEPTLAFRWLQREYVWPTTGSPIPPVLQQRHVSNFGNAAWYDVPTEKEDA